MTLPPHCVYLPPPWSSLRTWTLHCHGHEFGRASVPPTMRRTDEIPVGWIGCVPHMRPPLPGGGCVTGGTGKQQQKAIIRHSVALATSYIEYISIPDTDWPGTVFQPPPLNVQRREKPPVLIDQSDLKTTNMDEPDDVTVDMTGLHNDARTRELSVGPSYKSTWSKHPFSFNSSCIWSMLRDTVYNITSTEWLGAAVANLLHRSFWLRLSGVRKPFYFVVFSYFYSCQSISSTLVSEILRHFATIWQPLALSNIGP